MNLKITSASNLSIGGATVSNIIGTVEQHLSLNDAGELVGPCDIKWWLTLADKDANKDGVYPLMVDGITKITNASVSLTQAEALAANLPVTVYNNVKDALIVSNPAMTIIVEI